MKGTNEEDWAEFNRLPPAHTYDRPNEWFLWREIIRVENGKSKKLNSHEFWRVRGSREKKVPLFFVAILDLIIRNWELWGHWFVPPLTQAGSHVITDAHKTVSFRGSLSSP